MKPPVLELLDSISRLSRHAGDAILDIYGEDDFETAADARAKADASPLTAADLASDSVIQRGLRELTPDIPILSEESRELPFEERKSWSRFWLVDPLDGTKEFLKRNGEFTVNIALVEHGSPVLGVVHAPVLGVTYSAARGHGAWKAHSGSGPAASGDGETKRSRIAARTADSADELEIVASRSHPSPTLAELLGRLPPHKLVNMGSSLKLCLVAEGAADLYPRLGPTMEWDTGAAHAVVEAAGGRVVDTDSSPLRYNKQDLLNPHFLVLPAGDRPWFSQLGGNSDSHSEG